MNYKLIRSRRRSVGIEIDAEGALIVRAPLTLQKVLIDEVVRKKRSWILKKQGEMNKRHLQRVPRKFKHGENFLIWGCNHSLDVNVDSSNALLKVELKDGRIQMCLDQENPEKIRILLENWYRTITKEFIEECVAFYQPYFSKKVNRITIKNQRSRWGSCSSKHNLNFNWRLSMAPKEVVEYVVVHELCHLVHMNHSEDFWKLVASFDPNYKMHRSWLKEHGHQLYWDAH